MTLLASLASLGRRARSVSEALLPIMLVVTCAAILWRVGYPRPSAGPTAVRNVPLPPPRRVEPPPPVEPISIAGAAIQGSSSAKAVIVEYSDFQCPFCGQFARDLLPLVEKQYVATGRARIAFQQMPLPIHQFAFEAAVASECAGQQGKFWPMHDALFADQKDLGSAQLHATAVKLGSNPDQFDSCVADKAVADKVKQSLVTASGLSISGTPTFFVGAIQSDGRVKVTKRFTGVTSLVDFGAAIDAASASTDAVSAKK